jgi:hypothetical protein
MQYDLKTILDALDSIIEKAKNYSDPKPQNETP